MFAPPVINVDIHQQPNDAADAARLYGECRTRAEEAVANSTVERLGASNFLVAKIATSHRYDTDQYQYRFLFTLNGARYDITCTLDRLEEVVKHKIAVALVEQLVKEMKL